MKLYLSLTVFLFINLTSYQQNTFELIIPNDKDQKPSGLISSSNGNLIIGFNNYVDEIPVSSVLYEVDQNGIIMNQKEIPTSNSYEFEELIALENNFIIIGSISDTIISDNNLCFSKFSYQFDSLYQKSYNITNVKISQTHSIINHNKNIVTVGFGFENGLFPKIFICEIDTLGNLIQSVNFLGNDYGWATGIIEKQDNTGYFIFTYGGFYNIGGHPGQIAILNNYFEIDTVIRTPNDLHYQYSAKWIVENEYILAGRYVSLVNFTEDIGIVRADTNQNVQYHFETGLSGDRDSPAFDRSMDFISTDNIYLGGTYDYAENNNYTPYQNKENVITLCNFNEYLDLNWQIYYGGDAFYNLYYVLASKDGGCLLLGTKYDANNHYNYRDIYILKVDSLGNLSSINYPDARNKKIMIYPNPCVDVINIKLPANKSVSDLKLYNITGKLIFEKEIFSKMESFNVSFLKSGLYFYKIYTSDNNIYSGKWIKQ